MVWTFRKVAYNPSIGLDTEQMTEQVAYNLDLDCIGLDKGSTGTFTNTIHKGMTILAQ